MGVKNLWDILESCKKTLPLHHLQNKRVCVDLSCWMVQLQNVNKSHCALKDKLYLKGLFHRLRALIALNCSLIFVTDGSIPAIKLATYKQRLNLGHEESLDETNSQKACSLRRNMGSEFSRMIKEAKILGSALGIPSLDSIEEAEAQCALLNSESLCDGCCSSDSDIFLFGARTVYRDICLGEGGHVICYEMADIERKLGFGRNSLISLALFLGSDYSQGVHGLGPESVCQVIKSVGDDNILQQIASEGLSLARKKNGSKKQTQITKCNTNPNILDPEVHMNGNEYHLEGQKQFLQVIDAYLKPKCHAVDSDAVYRVLAQHAFQRARLQEICEQFFGWPPEKTDEYVLPKIAERDLRRYANLHSASSGVGLMSSSFKIPVKCPVSGIIKNRKVQGRDCFEVSWEGVDGLENSIVPADLIQRACPEKISEFEERRTLGKKKNHNKPKPKKSDNSSAQPEMDAKLQALLLDIESHATTAFGTFIPPRTMISNDRNTATMVDSTTEDPINRDLASNVYSQSDKSCYYVDTSLAKTEVIDLSSPTPPRHAITVSRCKQIKEQSINVIDLSDSESEMSPEHARKARELRSFIASIRDDIY